MKWEEVGCCKNLMLSNDLALEIATYAQPGGRIGVSNRIVMCGMV